MKNLQMLTSEETADLFGISMETLRMWQETGVLLPIKTEKNYMYSQSAIERFQEKYEGFDMSTPEGVNKAYNTLNINETKATIKEIGENIESVKLSRSEIAYSKKELRKKKILKLVKKRENEGAYFTGTNKELEKQFNCSCTTVVKCINELISEGKLYRHIDVYGGERTLSTKPFK